MKFRFPVLILALVGLFGGLSETYAWVGPPVADLRVSPEDSVVTSGGQVQIKLDASLSFHPDGSGGINGIEQFQFDWNGDNDYSDEVETYPSCDGIATRTFDWDDSGINVVGVKVIAFNGSSSFTTREFRINIEISVPDSGNGIDTIQDAIDLAIDGSTVTVAKGTYTGDGNRDITFSGKAIIVTSTDLNDPYVVKSTIIDCGGNNSDYHRGFKFVNTADSGVVLAGFTIRNGYQEQGGAIWVSGNDCSPTIRRCVFTGNAAPESGSSYVGGAVYCNGASPVIEDCVFTQNQAYNGGGLYTYGGSPILINCAFIENSAKYLGGGLYIRNSSSTELSNCVLSQNTAIFGGGAYIKYSSATVMNCTFNANWAANTGGAIRSFESSPIVTNSIFWGNIAPYYKEIGVGVQDTATPIVSFCDVEGGYSGTANINVDPKFIYLEDPVNDSVVGPDGYYGTWDDGLVLSCDSPCIDMGDDAITVSEGITTDIVGKNRIADGDHDDITDPDTEVDMGAYELPRIWFVDKDGTTPPPAQTGHSWAEAYTDLQAVLILPEPPDSSDLASGDEIWVVAASSPYKPDSPDPLERALSFQMCAGVATYGGFVGTEVGLRMRSWENNETVLSGDLAGDDAGNPPDDDNNYHVVVFSAADGAVLDGFIIEGGNASVDDTFNYYDRGGGIASFASSPVIRNCTVTNNSALLAGGGMYAHNSRGWNANPQLVNCKFTDNRADDGDIGSYDGGGGLAAYGCQVTMTDCDFTDNHALYGGGMVSANTDVLGLHASFSGCTFTGNVAKYDGGGMYNWDSSPQLSSCTFDDNQAGELPVPGGSGGGIYNRLGGGGLTNCKFRGNTAVYNNGGGIYNDMSCPVLINCLFSGNTANGGDSTAGGGAIYNWIQSHAILINCTLSGNNAPGTNGRGGGIYNKSGVGLSVYNCIIWGNFANAGDAEICDSAASLTIQYSDVAGSFSGQGNINSNPKFVSNPSLPSDFGDLHLQSDSPCINAGDKNLVPGVTRDLHGRRRIIGIDVDMGAYEFNHAPVAEVDPRPAVDDEIDTNLETAVSIYVLANDTDEDAGDAAILSVAEVTTAPADGSVTNNHSFVIYTPGPGFMGVDTFTYKASDGDDTSGNATVTVKVHPPIAVNAGFDQTIELPTNWVRLDGKVLNDYSGRVESTEWSLVSVPLEGDINFVVGEGGSGSLEPKVEFSAADRYTMRLEAKDQSGSVIGYDEVWITVKPGGGEIPGDPGDYYHDPPQVNAGLYTGITLGPDGEVSIRLDKAVAMDDGKLSPVLTYMWTIVSGKDSMTFNGTSDSTGDGEFSTEYHPSVTFTEDTDYVLEFTAYDGELYSSPGLTTIRVGKNQAPAVEIDPVEPDPYELVSPTEERVVTLNATVTDDHLSVKDLDFQWWVVEGPKTGIRFDSLDIEDPTVTITLAGTYKLKLEVSDGQRSGSAEEEFTVNPPASFSLTVDASLDNSSVVLEGEVTNRDSTVDLYGTVTCIGDILTDDDVWWMKWSGPGDVEFGEYSLAELDTTAKFSKLGDYVLRLKAQKGGLIEYEDLAIKVKPGTVLAGGEAHTLIRAEDGTVWACGYNSQGQLGNNTVNHQDVVVQVITAAGLPLPDIDAVAAGWSHSMALDSQGNVWAWGENRTPDDEQIGLIHYTGQLGVGDGVDDSKTPVQVHGENGSGFLEDIVAIATGRSGTHSLAVEKNGVVWSWGYNKFGQLGNGKADDEPGEPTPEHEVTPVPVLSGAQGIGDNLANIKAVSGGAYHSVALEKTNDADQDQNGRVYTWGDNTFKNAVDAGTETGKLGGGDALTDTLSSLPVQVVDVTGTGVLQNIVAVSAGWHHTMALEKLDDNDPALNGRVYTWGWNGDGAPDQMCDVTGCVHYANCTGGRLGDPTVPTDGTSPRSNMPVLVNAGYQDDDYDDPSDPYPTEPLQNIIAISAGESHCMALDTDGCVWVWGDNKYGQVGNGKGSEDYPGGIMQELVPCKVMAPDLNGNGEADDGYLGEKRLMPKIVAIAAGYWHCLAMDEMGNVYSWGMCNYGRLGNGTCAEYRAYGEGKNIPQRVIPLFDNLTVHNTNKPQEYGWYSEIQAAIDDADDGDEIVVYPKRVGSYYDEEIVLDGVPQTGDPTAANLTIRGTYPDDWDAVAATAVTQTVSGAPIIKVANYSGLKLSGLTLKNCGASSDPDESGIRIKSSSNIDIGNCVVEGNRAHGIECTNSNLVTIRNSRILWNGWYHDRSGVYCDGSEVTISDCQIEINADYGIRCKNSSTATIEDSRIIYSFIDGVYCDGSSQATVRGCEIEHNGGTGLKFMNAHAEVTGCVIQNNNGTEGPPGQSSGQGIYYFNSTLVSDSTTITNNIIAHNASDGIYYQNTNAEPESTNTVQMKNNLIFSNGQEGIFIDGGDQANVTAMIRNCTIADHTNNDAEYTPYAVECGPNGTISCEISNCIAWGNNPTHGNQLNNCNDVKYSCIQNNGSTDNYNTYQDPDFLSGGENDYHLSGDTSPCYNTGDLSQDYTGETDIDGQPRVMLLDRVDIGADEYTPVSVDAGPDERITLLDPVLPLEGVVDAGEQPGVVQQWTVVEPAGSSSAVFDYDEDVDTKVTFTAIGTYVLKLTAYDSAIDPSKILDWDTVTMTVDPGVDAGEDKEDVLPTSGSVTVRLNGRMAGAAVVGWAYQAGDEQSLKSLVFDPEFRDDPVLDVTFSLPGNYKFDLVAWDSDLEEVARDTAWVTINLPGVEVDFGEHSTVWLGPDGIATLEIEATISGAGTWDSAEWSAPDNIDLTPLEYDRDDPESDQVLATATFYGQADYGLRLQINNGRYGPVGAGSVVIEVRYPNITADAGENQYLTLEIIHFDESTELVVPGHVGLDGTISGGKGFTGEWVAPVGSGVRFDEYDPSDPDTSATFTQTGRFELALKAKDDTGQVLDMDTVWIYVTDETGGYDYQGPGITLETGGPYTATWSESSVVVDLHDFLFDDGGLGLTLVGEGPEGVSFAFPPGDDPVVTITNPQSGLSYKLWVRAIDSSSGADVAYANVYINVEDAPVIVEAGTYAAVTLSTYAPYVDLDLDSASIEDPASQVEYYKWIQTNGPAGVRPVEFTPSGHQYNLDDLDATARFFAASSTEQYELKLAAFDSDDYLLREDTVSISVGYECEENQPPRVEAGTYGPIRLADGGGPVELNFNPDMTWYEDDGRPVGGSVKAAWDISGPGEVTLEKSVNQFHPVKATFTNIGVYDLTVTATDGDVVLHPDALASEPDTLTIIVYPHDQPTEVEAGSDKMRRQNELEDPIEVYLHDAYAIYDPTMELKWTKVEGHDSLQFIGAGGTGSTTSSIEKAKVVLFEAGTYKLRLAVLEDTNIVKSDIVTIVINPPGGSDVDPPTIDFEANNGGASISEGQQNVYGNVEIAVEALDVGYGLEKLELGLFEGDIPVTHDMFDTASEDQLLRTVTGGDPFYPSALRLERSIHTLDMQGVFDPLSIETTFTLAARATDCDNPGNNSEIETLTFNISLSPPNGSADPPIAKIHAPLLNTGVEAIARLDLPVVEIVEDGFYQFEGTADHGDDTVEGVQYKIELFKAEIGEYSYNLGAWNLGYTIGQECFVKNITPGIESGSEFRLADEEGDLENKGKGFDHRESGSLELDLTGVENGAYEMLLTVETPDGGTGKLYAYAHAPFVLDSPLKIGNVKFSQEDVVIPVGGIPLRVIRTYDSLNRNVDGDFGFGWSYSIADMDIELNEARQTLPSLTEESSGGAYASVRYCSNYSRNVTFTLPDGRRTTFLFYLKEVSDDSGNPCAPSNYKAMYASPPGVAAKLQTWDPSKGIETDIMDAFGFWGSDSGSTWGIGGAIAESDYYDFAGYVLTTAEGTEYYIKRKKLVDYGYDDGDIYYYDTDGQTSVLSARPYGVPYLSHIVTPSGETIVLNVDEESLQIGQKGNLGIRHYAKGIIPDNDPDNYTKAIKIEYDPAGHIVAVWAPNEQSDAFIGDDDRPTIKYSYDSQHNLTAVHKLIDKYAADVLDQYETTTYVYDDDGHDPVDHFVTEIEDPRGLSPITYEYDDSGRLIYIYDAKGKPIPITHDTESRTEVVEDRAGNSTVYTYNERGNVVSVKDAMWQAGSSAHETVYAYDDQDNPDRPTSITRIVPGPNPGELVESTTWHVYENHEDGDDFGQLKRHTTIDPAGNVADTYYDTCGNVTKAVQGRIEPFDPSSYDPAVNGLDCTEVSTTRNAYNNDKLLIFSGIASGDFGSHTWHSITVYYYTTDLHIQHQVRLDLSEMDPTTDFDHFNTLVNDNSDIPALNFFSSIENLQDLRGGVLDKYVVTKYDYNPASGSDDQPYSISNPYFRKDEKAGAAPVYVRHFEYDENGSQDMSWYDWDDPSTGSGVDHTVYSHIVPDDAGRALLTSRQIDEEVFNPDIATLLSQTFYNEIGKTEATYNEFDIRTEHSYDELGNLVETRTYETLPSGAVGAEPLTVSQTLYDIEGRVLVTVDPHEPGQPVNGTENVYDELGRVVETRRWMNVELDLVPFVVVNGETVEPGDPDWPSEPVPVGMKVRSGVEVVNAWNGVDPEPTNIGWKSDEMLPVAADIADYDPVKHIAPLSYSRTVYDSAGRVRHAVTLDESVAEQPATYAYDIAGRQIEVIGPEGHTFEWTSNDRYLPNKRCIYDPVGNENIASKWIDFDQFDYSVYEAGVNDAGNFTGTHKTTTAYEGTRRKSVTDARDNTTSFEYDALGRVITTTHPPTVENGVTYSHVGYDSLGRKEWQSAQTRQVDRDHVDTPLEDDDLKLRKREYQYDAAGRLTAVILPAVALDPGDPAVTIRPRYEYYYDQYGNLEQIWDNISQNPTNPSDINADNARQTSFTYDELHNQISKTLPGIASPETKLYDEYGRIVAHADFKEQTTEYVYNSRGLLEYKRYYEQDGDLTNGVGVNQNYLDENWAEYVQYVYDDLGRRREVISSSVGTTTYYYDDATGNLEKVESPEGTVNYAYHAGTNRKATTYTDNTEVAYGYDALGRLEVAELQKRNGAPLGAFENTTYGYNEVGSRGTAILPNSVETKYTYDNLNRLTLLTHTDLIERVLGQYTYTLGADGRREAVSEAMVQTGALSGTPATETHGITYTYDNLNRILEEVATDGGTGGYSTLYEYDLVGNRTKRIVNVGAQQLVTDYTYDTSTSPTTSNDRLETEVHTGPVAFYMHNRRVYAYAEDGRLTHYRMDGVSGDIGQFKAFLLGLPSKWSQYFFRAIMLMLALSVIAPALICKYARLRKLKSRGPRIRLSLYHRCLSALLAYLMLIGPVGFEQSARGDTQYTNLATTDWSQGDRTVEYLYDNNGSVTQKLTKQTSSSTELETVTNYYNLQNRLERVAKEYEDGGTVNEVTEYTYNDNGIRVKSYYHKTVDGGARQDEETKIFLVDAHNHTGYAQVLEELTYNYADPDLLSDPPTSRKTYTIGDDVITQHEATTGSQHLLYDGHGSTRQLSMPESQAPSHLNEVEISALYSYDAYGVMLGGNPTWNDNPSGATRVSSTTTNLLYAGEQFDNDAQQYCLRARYYDPLNGRFNRTDPYAGNNSDPQSLHKYLYCHANPINSIDPSGMFSLGEINLTMSIQAALFTLNGLGAIYHARGVVVSLASVWNAWMRGDFWGGLPYIVLALVHGIHTILNVIGMVAAVNPPPGMGPALSAIGVGTLQGGHFWTVMVSNPALAQWVVKTVAPAAMAAYTVFMAKTGGGSGGSSGSDQNHHKVPYNKKKFGHHKHKLVKQARWGEKELFKDPANRMRLGNHSGGHSDLYHENIQQMMDEAYKRVGGRGKAAAKKALYQLFEDIDEGIANGTLKPYKSKDVWIPTGE